MPYIEDANRRCDLSSSVAVPRNPGELSFTIATVIDDYFAVADQNFENLNAVKGVLDSLGCEIQRRFLDPYEEKKLQENGEVFFNLKGPDNA